MELTTFNVFLSAYIPLWLMCVWQLYLPSLKILGKVNPSNPVYKHKVAGGIIFAIFALFTTPFIAPCIFSVHLKKVFLKYYLEAVTGAE